MNEIETYYTYHIKKARNFINMMAVENKSDKNLKNKILIQKATGKIYKKLKKNKSNYLFGAEYEISTSLLSNIERGLKDPQLTTVFKLSEALGLKAHEFIKEIEEILPNDFSLIDT